jgi:hypothetical protein
VAERCGVSWRIPFFSLLSDSSSPADQFAKDSRGGTTVSIKGTLALIPPQGPLDNRSDNLVMTQLAVDEFPVLATSSQSAQFVDMILSARQ